MDKINSVYEPPESKLEASIKFEVPEEVLKKIRGGWIAATTS